MNEFYALVRGSISKGAREKILALPDFDDEMPTRVGLRMPRRRSVSVERQKLRALGDAALVQVSDGIVHVIRSADFSMREAFASGWHARYTCRDVLGCDIPLDECGNAFVQWDRV